MASWFLTGNAIISLTRPRFHLDVSAWSARALYLNKAFFNASFVLPEKSPSMKAMESYPYPTTSPDSSVFEDLTEEYASPAPASYETRQLLVQPKYIPGAAETASIAPRYPCYALYTLVEQRNYADAEQVRSDLEEMGVPIRRDIIYEQVAWEVLRTAPMEDRVKAFVTWFSLISDAHSIVKRRSFSAIRYQLFRAADLSNPTNVELIMQFGLICARKGWAIGRIPKRVIPAVIRLTEPSVGSAYLNEFTAVAGKYAAAHPLRLKLFRNRARTWYSTAAKVQSRMGRTHAAVDLVYVARSKGISISDDAFRHVLDELRKSLEPALFRYVLELQRQQRQGNHGWSGSSFEEAWAQAESRLRAIPGPLEIPESTLAEKLKFLRWAIVDYPGVNASKLADFMKEYFTATGRTKGLELLRDRAYARGVRSTSLWLLAEMVYHAGRREHRQILNLYARHFYALGVPTGLIEQCLSHLSVHSQRKLIRPLLPAKPGNRKPKEKQWPTPHHVSNVWTALVELSRTRETLDFVYSRFLDEARLLRGIVANPVTFMPFVKAYGVQFRDHRAAGMVMANMVKLGVIPDIWVYAYVLGIYARAGDARYVFSVLHRMEAGVPALKDRQLEDDEKFRSEPPSEVPLTALPEPNLSLYTTLLVGFAKARRVDAAREIERRIVRDMGIVPGMNPTTDRALSLFRDVAETMGS